MATISTSQDFDSAARAAGEAHTIQNGARLTLNTDTRYHKNAPAAGVGSMGSITMTAATGGEFYIDGTQVWLIPYNGGVGNVPSSGTILTGETSGATGEIMNISSAINAAPTASGSPMPATGYIKLKTRVGVFSIGENLRIPGPTTIAVSVNAGARGFLEVVMDDAAGFTIARSQKFTVRGDWYVSETTTNGSRGQQIQLPNYGGANFFLPGVWIETGVATNQYEFYPAVLAGTGSPWTTANLGIDERSKFVQCLAGGIIRIGSDGTNNIGHLPPSGCRIRIPNILLKSCATATRASDSVPNGTLTTRPDFTVTNAGQIDVDGAIGHWQMNLGQAFSISLKRLALFDQYTITECASQIVLEDTHNGNYTIAQDAPALVLTSNFAGGVFNNCKFGRSGTIAASDFGVNTTLCNNFNFNNCHFQNRTLRTNAASYTANFSQCNNITLSDCITIGSGIQFSTCFGTRINTLLYADSFQAVSSGTNAPLGAIMLVNYTTDTIIDNFGYFTSTANIHPDTCVVYLSAAVGVVCRSIGTRTSPLNGGTVNAILNFMNDAGNSANIKIQRVYMNNIATALIANTNSSKNIIIENCAGDYADADTQAGLNLLIKNLAVASRPNSGASIYGSIWYHIFTSITAGRLGITLNEPSAEYAAFVTTNFTSSATGISGFNSNGGLALINSGDSCIFEFPYTILGIDSFQNVAPIITTATNMLIEYQIDTGSGYSIWKTFNAANLSAEIVNPSIGFKFKIRATATATNAANILTVIYALTNSNAAAQDIQYPLNVANITLTGIQAGTEIHAYVGTDPLTNTEIAVTEFSGTSFTFTQSVSGQQGYITLIKRGLKYQRIDLTYGSNNIEIPVFPQIDLAYNNP
jgi:hypothetical protein